jgi:hypothetical protein
MKFTDQWCLNGASQHFEVCQLSRLANIGFWRSESVVEYEAIDQGCLFLHVHMFQPLRTVRQWIDKKFALHCLEFLCASTNPEHRVLLGEILSRDCSGWYESSLRLT